MKIRRIIKGILVEKGDNFIHADDPNSVYLTERGTVSVRDITEYDNAGNLVKYERHLPDGPLEYSIDDLMKDAIFFDNSAFLKNVIGWKLIGNNKIANNKDTLEIEIIKNNLGVDVFICIVNEEYRHIKIFEIFDTSSERSY
jgi:hypothetical protein